MYTVFIKDVNGGGHSYADIQNVNVYDDRLILDRGMTTRLTFMTRNIIMFVVETIQEEQK